jgi:hypothetical protein
MEPISMVGVAVSLFVIFGMATGADTQIIGGTLKITYENYVSEKTNNKFPLKDLFKWVDVDFAGSEVVYDAHVHPQHLADVLR